MAGSERDAKPGEERTTERRMVAASTVMQAASEVHRAAEVAGEDFLFHLYRGSELLQDNRVHEAKEELEQALTLQPRDPKSQDLLAVVYFRIGLYPRAIQIFEQLKRDNPQEPSIKLNLALCYLKTGRADTARSELEDVVRLHPAHKRAWGYLGLAYERVGELEKARNAFERGGHGAMAARLGERLAARGAPASAAPVSEAVRSAASAAFEDLDAGEITFSLAEPTTGSAASGTWRAVEPGVVMAPPRSGTEGWTVPPSAEAVASVRAEANASPHAAETPIPGPPSPTGAPPALPALAQLARSRALPLPVEAGVHIDPTGLALVRVARGKEARPFAARLEAVRFQTEGLSVEILPRQTQGKTTGDSVGGVASPLVRIGGSGAIALAPRPSHAVVAFTIAEENVVLVEDVLLGFEAAAIDYDSGKLPLGDGDTANVIDLRGSGAVLLELLGPLHAIALEGEHPTLVRRDALLGWTGSISARPLPPAEAPSGQRGLLVLSGSGTALVSSS